MNEGNNFQTIDYRLTNIENSLTELKNVVLENKLQARDIKEISEKVVENKNRINELEERLRILENAPQKQKAEKWQFVLDYTFKTVVMAAISYILIKFKRGD